MEEWARNVCGCKLSVFLRGPQPWDGGIVCLLFIYGSLFSLPVHFSQHKQIGSVVRPCEFYRLDLTNLFQNEKSTQLSRGQRDRGVQRRLDKHMETRLCRKMASGWLNIGPHLPTIPVVTPQASRSQSWCGPGSKLIALSLWWGKAAPWESIRGETGLLFKSTDFRTLRSKLLPSSGHPCRAH